MDNSKTLIVCDTNIWYYISNGTISKQEIADKYLVGTFITGVELCSTPNAYMDYGRYRTVVEAFTQAHTFYTESPFDYMKLISGHQSSHSKWDNEIIITLEAILKTKNLPRPELTKRLVDAYIERVKRDNQPFISFIEQYRSNIVNKRQYKIEMNTPGVRLSHLESTKALLTVMVGGLALNWEALELCLLTFDEWLRQLLIQPSLKLKANDWKDILNLVYVQPGSLYWTSDERKTKAFIHGCGCGHYLYQ